MCDRDPVQGIPSQWAGSSGHQGARLAELGLRSWWSDSSCPLAVDRGPSEPSLLCCPLSSVFLSLSISGLCMAPAGAGSAPGLGALPGSGEHRGPGRGAARSVHSELAAAVRPMRPEGEMEQEQFRELPGLGDGEPEVSASHSCVRPQRTPSSGREPERSVTQASPGED